MTKVAQNDQRSDAPSQQEVRTLTRVARRAADAGDEDARSARTENTGPEREPARAATEETAAAGGSMLALFAKQTRHSMEATAAIGRAKNWVEVAQVQANFIGGSLERLGQMNDVYLTLVRTGAKSMPFLPLR